MAISTERQVLIQILERLREIEKHRIEDTTTLMALVSAYCASQQQNFLDQLERERAKRPPIETDDAYEPLLRLLKRDPAAN